MKSIQIILVLIIIPSIVLSFSGKGSGTEADPYQITNIDQLQEVKNKTRAFYILMNNIDASETRNWNIGDHDRDSTTPDEPMGFYPISFHFGNFNGMGFIIKNLYINRPEHSYVGLFGDCHASVIKKVGIENCDFTGGYNIGGLCAMSSMDTIEECYTTGKITVAETYYPHEHGAAGFCGNIDISRIRNCYSSCTVSSASEQRDYFLASFSCASYSGFFVGKCYTTGKVDSPKKVYLFGPDENVWLCFWDVETTGIPDTMPYESPIGLPTSEMMKRSTFEPDWDFDSIWCIDEGKDYPKLRAFGNCPTDVEPNNLKTDGFMIDAYPNPLSNYTEIRYSIPTSSSITIKIYNILGVQIKEVLNEAFHKDGSYKVTINALDFPAGIYFVTLKAGRETLTKQIVVLR